MHLPYLGEVSFRHRCFKLNYLLCWWDLHLTTVVSVFCHLKFVANMMFCKDGIQLLDVVGFSGTECVGELLRFHVLFGGLLFISCARCFGVYGETSNNRSKKGRVLWFRSWTAACPC